MGAMVARREPCGVWAVRACGALERERREAERAEGGESGAERAAERTGAERQHRRWYCTALWDTDGVSGICPSRRRPLFPINGTTLRGEEVAATFGDTEDLSPRALFADTIRSTRAQTQFG